MVDAGADVVHATASGMVVRLRWRRPDDDAGAELFQVLRLRDGRVVDVQDHDDRRRAVKAVGASRRPPLGFDFPRNA